MSGVILGLAAGALGGIVIKDWLEQSVSAEIVEALKQFAFFNFITNEWCVVGRVAAKVHTVDPYTGNVIERVTFRLEDRLDIAVPGDVDPFPLIPPDNDFADIFVKISLDTVTKGFNGVVAAIGDDAIHVYQGGTLIGQTSNAGPPVLISGVVA